MILHLKLLMVPIAAISLSEKGKGYTRLPGVSTVTSDTGTGAILEASSTSIGVPQTTKLKVLVLIIHQTLH